MEKPQEDKLDKVKPKEDKPREDKPREDKPGKTNIPPKHECQQCQTADKQRAKGLAENKEISSATRFVYLCAVG